MNHNESFERMSGGSLGEQAEFMKKLGLQAEESNAETASTSFTWLKESDMDCDGMYTPEVIFRVRRIGPDMRE